MPSSTNQGRHYQNPQQRKEFSKSLDYMTLDHMCHQVDRRLMIMTNHFRLAGTLQVNTPASPPNESDTPWKEK